ncbi:ABC transporter permease [Klebsiella sp. RHBSTW-00484]|uniref:ABC transporter permease n=1 Tax=unclassified Klebsiella TaxID=2608929 RepID=UPI0015E50DFB|nr:MULTISPECIES: ABC transporter permease [unclassified Klebsiella]MBA7845713.1 ABC transporter permease [Klebsiella sp. RHBSTW-00465]QLO38346.1 ABC transporter permease [Klebsiella sp. RHBSTW-00484]QLT77866.1 ABC transporter permease [Klebsiella sp. RHBSTW-00464]
MSKDMMFINCIVILVLLFIMYNIAFRFGDVKFAFLNLLRHRRRTFSTILAIILGGCAIFLYGGFINYSFWILKEQTIRTNIGHVQIYNKSYFDTSNKNKSIIVDYTSLKDNILNNPDLFRDISTISGQLEFTGIISHYESETSNYFSALGVEPLPALKLGAFDKIVFGSDLSRVKNNEITIGSGLAKTLDSQYGDWLDVIVINTAGGQGAMSLKLRGIFESGIKDYDDVAMKIPLDTAQKIMGTNSVSKILILLKNDDVLPFLTKLKKYIANNKLPLIVKDWKSSSLYYQQVEGMLSGIYFFIKLIVALIVVFMISNSMTMNIVERTREITTLRAIGLQSGHVTLLFWLEGVFVGIIGALGSLIVGYAISAMINISGVAMPPSPGQSAGYTAFIKTDNAELIWITIVLPIIISALASILPAIRASRLNISDAFKSS